MLERYDLIIDVNYPEDAAALYPVNGGKWVEAEEAEGKIELLKESLLNLRNCNIKYNTPELLNNYVDSVLEGL